MNGLFDLTTWHGAMVVVETATGSVVSSILSSIPMGHERLVAYVSPYLADCCFIMGRASQVDHLTIQPNISGRVVIAVGLAHTSQLNSVSLYERHTSRWIGAAPANTIGLGSLSSDVCKRQAYEVFTFSAVGPDDIGLDTRLLMKRIDRLLESRLDVASLQELPCDLVSAGALEAVASVLPEDDLMKLSSALMIDLDLRDKVAAIFPGDVFARIALPRLASWASQRRDQPRVSSLSADYDDLGFLGFGGRYVSLPYHLNALARQEVRPSKAVCIVATVRNEGLYLVEWIAYHRSIGISDFFIYSNDNDDGSDELLQALADVGAINWRRNTVGLGGSAQRKAYGHALGFSPEVLDFRWALLIDADEYLTLNAEFFHSVSEYLGWIETREVDCIAINWVMYGSSGEVRWRNDFIARRFPSPVGGANIHVKSMLRPRRFIHASAHYPYAVKDGERIFKDASGYPHKHREGVHRHALSVSPQAEYAWISHYYYKSKEEFLWKWARNRGDYPKESGFSETALSVPFVHEFIEQFNLRQESDLSRSTVQSSIDECLSDLLKSSAVKTAFESAQRRYMELMPMIVDLLRTSQAILGSGEHGQMLLDISQPAKPSEVTHS